MKLGLIDGNGHLCKLSEELLVLLRDGTVTDLASDTEDERDVYILKYKS